MALSLSHHDHGVTLLELLLTIVVLSVLLAIAVPAMNHFVEKNRLRDAAESIFTELRYARSEAIKRKPTNHVAVSFTTDGATDWCFGIREDSACDCHENDIMLPNACMLNIAGTNTFKRRSSSEFPSISLTSASFFTGNPWTGFSPVRGTADNGSVVLQSNSGWELRVIVSPLGRVRICSPSGASYVTGYTPC